MYYRILHIFITILFFCSCNSDKKNTKEQNKMEVIEEFKAGTIINKIKCKKTAGNFSLYLPFNYSKDKKWPVIYFFDSHARGKMPLELYKEIAEKYGYILIGSNNSKNGIDYQITNQMIDELLNDTYQRLSLDYRRIYLCGFSGGAKVAGNYAFSSNNINTIIGCSAPQPFLNTFNNSSIKYVAVIGKEDFNYYDVIEQKSYFESKNIKTFFLEFNGIHQWPPLSTMDDVICWLELNSIREKTVDSTIIDINKYYTIKNNELNKIKNNTLAFAKVAENLINYFDGLVEINMLKTNYNKFIHSENYRLEINQINEIKNKEMQFRQEYTNAIFTQDIHWWHKTISNLEKKSSNTLQTEMNKRLISYLGMMCYVICNSSLNKNDLENLEKTIHIYQMVDKSNPDQNYFSSCLYLKKNEIEKSFTYLTEAVKLGYFDRENLEQNPLFNPIKNINRFKQILDSIN